MSTRNVRDVIITGWEGVLLDAGCHPGEVHAIALKLAAVAEGHAVALSRPAHLHDPVADDWRGDKRPTPGDPQSGRKAVLEAMRPYEGPTHGGRAPVPGTPKTSPRSPEDEAERPSTWPPPSDQCPEGACGLPAHDLDEGDPLLAGWVRIEVLGSAAPARLYCACPCAMRGAASAGLSAPGQARP